MQNFVVIVGVVGSFASILSLLIPRDGMRGKLLHAAYVFVITCIASIAVFQERQIASMRSIEQDATELISRADMMTPEGFIQATLAFLEKHREEFPDAYLRATKMCEDFRCFSPEADGYDLIDVSSQMRGLIRGVATLSN
jgi:hypothetical protein